jgi:hypothetical protein
VLVCLLWDVLWYFRNLDYRAENFMPMVRLRFEPGTSLIKAYSVSATPIRLGGRAHLTVIYFRVLYSLTHSWS